MTRTRFDDNDSIHMDSPSSTKNIALLYKRGARFGFLPVSHDIKRYGRWHLEPVVTLKTACKRALEWESTSSFATTVSIKKDGTIERIKEYRNDN